MPRPGANWVSVHYEACRHLHRTLEYIAQHKMEPAVVINPHTEVDLLIPVLGMVHHVLVMSVNPGFGGQQFIPYSLNKIRRLKELRRELGLSYRIEVDGGIAHDTVASVVEAGAELLVAGNAVFGQGHAERDARSLLEAAQRAARSAAYIGFPTRRGVIADHPTPAHAHGASAIMRCYESVGPSYFGSLSGHGDRIFLPQRFRQEARRKRKNVDLSANPLANVQLEAARQGAVRQGRHTP